MDAHQKKVFLIQCGPRCRNQYLAILRDNDIPSWMYLGKDATRPLEIQSFTGPGATRIEIGDELQSVAKSCRQEYIDYIGRLSADSETQAWYITSLSEKNPFVSDFYLNYCYLRVVLAHVSSHDGNICFFCESRHLMEAIRKNLDLVLSCHVTVSTSPAPLGLDRIKMPVITVKNRLVFLFRYLFRIFLARICRYIHGNFPVCPPGRRVIAIHSWADDRSFSGGKGYLDVYFGDLGKKIEQNGMDSIYIVNVLPTLWYPKAILHLRSAAIRWILFEEFLCIADIIHAVVRTPCSAGYPKALPLLGGYNVASLVRGECLADCQSSRAAHSMLWYYAAQSMSDRLPLSALVYTFENHIWEKMLVLGTRRSNTRTRLIGYAHATVNPMELSYSIAAGERLYHPLPDSIAVNGHRAYDVLAGSGFPQDMVVVFGTLRYEHSKKAQMMEKSRRKKRILLVLSADFNRSVEMVLKARRAFSSTKDTDVVLKPHPTMKTTTLQPYLNKLPENFSVSTVPLAECLGQIDLVIYNDSTAAVEVAVNDIPLVHMKSDHTIDINVFEGVFAVPSNGNPDILHDVCRDLLGDPGRHTAEVHRYADQFFEPVNTQEIITVLSRP